MGNFSTKDGHGPTGPHLDLFHTPPTSPVTANLPTFPLPAPPTQDQQTPTAPLLKRPLLRIDPPTTSTTTTNSSPDCKTPLSVSPDHSVIGPGVSLLHNRVGSDAAPAEGRVASGCNGGPSNSTPRTLLARGKSSVSSPTKSPLSLGSPSSPVTPSEQSWKENDSGLSQSVLEGHGSGDSQGEMERLIQEGRAVLDLSPSQDSTMSVADLLRRLLSEVQSLRETMQTERGEWLQFQADLQVAVAVGDRLRAEAEEELSSLRVVHRDTEREMTAAQQRQKETDGQLVTLRGELRESRQRLANLTQTHGKIQDQAPTQAQIETQCKIQTQDQEKAAADNNTHESHDGTHRGRERGINRVGKGGGGRGEGMGSQDEGTMVVVVDEARTDPKGVTKDVAKRYLRNMTNEERSGEEGRATHETCRIATTERSRSLSRLPVSSDSPAVQNGTSQSNAGTTTGSTNKNLCQPRGKRGLERQDSWSSIHTGKQEETLNQYNTALTDLPPNKSTKPRSQDGFSQLLRRHGGSKRNSLLRWCQSRTQGYKNIDITNFSSSWADGLAFCAVYHTYLPSHIPYCTLSPESKMENLSLAFKTGENVGITQSLTVEEMLRAGGPDWQRVLGYVESMYRHFEM